MNFKIHHSLFWLIYAVLSAQTLQAEPTPIADEIVKANNAFAFDLYAHLAKQPGNLILSPFSIDTA